MEKNTFENPILGVGTHDVEIFNYKSDINQNTGSRYYKLIFTNEYGYLPEWFYITDNSKPFLKSLFTACGIEEDTLDFSLLVNKSVRIHLIKSVLINKSTGKVTRENKKIAKFEKAPGSDNIENNETDDDFDPSTDYIFGTSIGEVADMMGKSSSEISDGDVWEAMGY